MGCFVEAVAVAVAEGPGRCGESGGGCRSHTPLLVLYRPCWRVYLHEVSPRVVYEAASHVARR